VTSAKSKKELPTIHQEDWRDQALAMGWSEMDVDSLASVLAVSKTEDLVVEVTFTTILILSRTEFELFGINRDGVRTGTTVSRQRYWRWRYHARPSSRTERADEQTDKPWCPCHGFDCSPPRSHVCGRTAIIAIEPCECKGRAVKLVHQLTCEAGSMNASANLTAATKKIAKQLEIPVHRFGESETHQPTQPPADKTRRPSKATGWALPGQLGLGLPAPSKPR
jgi:hypothetical protein